MPNDQRSSSPGDHAAVPTAQPSPSHTSSIEGPDQSQRQALVDLFQAGQFDALASQSQQLSARFPHNAFLWKVQGMALAQLNQGAAALTALRQAAALNPSDAETLNAMGHALSGLNRDDEAMAAFRAALVINPHSAEIHFNLGILLLETGQAQAAEASLRRACALTPTHCAAHGKLARALQNQGRLNEAEQAYRQALQLDPHHHETLNNLGNLLLDLGRPEHACRLLEHLVEINPGFAGAHNNVGNAYLRLKRLEHAESSYRRALELDPRLADAHGNLGHLLGERGQLPEAESCLRHALSLDPLNARLYYQLGRVLEQAARADEAEALYRQALNLPTAPPPVLSNLLFTLAYAGLSEPSARVQYAARWERVVLSEAERKLARQRTLTPATRATRPLRIGLLSAELGRHAVADFLRSWLPHLDRSRCTLLMYPTIDRSEPEVEAFRALADSWTPLSGLSDPQAAARIREDQVDILIETGGHTADNRLGVIAQRAAPVQCHYIGYCGTTGLTEMDWYLADATLIPPSLDDQFREPIWRLPRPWHAYAPPEPAPEPRWSPDPQGTLWLGSFNNVEKIQSETLHLWAQVLCALPQAKLLLKHIRTPNPAASSRILASLAAAGVAADRILFAPPAPSWREHMAQYDQLDIALETVPYNGCTTTFEALWMGVPLLTLTGHAVCGRTGTAILTGLGHQDWIAESAQDYVAKVLALALDVETRRALRRQLREQMCRSPLCDGLGLARALEDSFEQMFDRWWQQHHPEPPEPPAATPEHLTRLWAESRFEELERAARQATERRPQDTLAWKLCAGARMQLGRQSAALVALERALALDDQDADTHTLLGRLHTAAGDYPRALQALNAALALDPQRANSVHDRGNVQQHLRHWDEAEADFRRALVLQPSYTSAHLSLGMLLAQIDRHDEAEQCFRAALAIDPQSIDGQIALGDLLVKLDRYPEAESCYRAVLTLHPKHYRTLCALGGLYSAWPRLEDSETVLRYAIALQAEDHRAHNLLGATLYALGRTQEALACMRRALALKPDDRNTYRNLLFTLGYSGHCEPMALRPVAEGWAQTMLSATAREAARQHRFIRDARTTRPLRLGILSAELGAHAVACFLGSWLRALDRQRVRVWMYPTSARPEAEAAPWRALADTWAPMHMLDDEDATARIRADQIDILIETSGHTSGDRLGIIARRAAPVQCHYIGYFATTGLTEMDYFIADAVLVPPAHDHHFTEQVWRLPRNRLAYEPLQSAPEPHWQPDPGGALRLGSFNNLTKVGAACLSLWGAVLRALPQARLVLKDRSAIEPGVQARILSALQAQGVGAERVEFLEATASWAAHMHAYDQIDIALDTLPMTSGTTGCDALWMGVPLVTLAGDRLAGRLAASLLSGLGRPEWIAADVQEYVRIITALAQDRAGLQAIRTTLRATMQASELCDGLSLARALEDSFEQMFDRWWQQHHPEPPEPPEPPAATPEHLTRLWDQGRLDELESAARQATERNPEEASAWKFYGGALMRRGQPTAALPALERALALNDRDADTHNLLSAVRMALGDHQRALEALNAAIALDAQYARWFHNRGLVQQRLAHWDEAEADFRQALVLQPDDLCVHLLLGQMLREQKRIAAAESCYQAALAVDPTHIESLCRLGSLYCEMGRLQDSERLLRQAIAQQPDDHRAHNQLNLTLQQQGRSQEAEACARRALALKPDDPNSYSNLLFTLSYSGLGTPDGYRRMAEGWEQAVVPAAERDAARRQGVALATRPERPLRLGILSAELGTHAVACFLRPWLRALDPQRFRVWMYPTNIRPEAETAPLRALAHAWTPLTGLSDQEAAAHIRADQIDILIETSGHTGAGLGIIARRAAPVQCHYIGYFATTGLTEMDYFIADPVLVPPAHDHHFTEQVWRLPRTRYVYEPPQSAPEPHWQPDPGGALRLGSFNSLAKVGPACLSLWSAVLRALPQARLVLKDRSAMETGVQARILSALQALGVGAERVEFLDTTASWAAHMRAYDQIDIALDTLPFTSATTGCDALWMGVPLVTLVGDRLAGRQAASLLSGLGRPEWIAADVQEYVRIITALAQDRAGLQALRTTLRATMQASELCDGLSLARALETAFAAMRMERGSAPHKPA